MLEKLVIITGANSGIGKAATLKFAFEKHHVIMACRNIERSERVREEIVKQTGNTKIELMKLDVSSISSIKNFHKEFSQYYPKLDILINNAGCFNHDEKKYQLSDDNIELTFATNTFGPYLLITLFRDLLAKSDDPRILNACSTNIRHFFDPKRKLELDNLQGEFKTSRPYNAYKMYGDSKMALMMLTVKFAEELKDLGIKINAVQIPAIKISPESIRKFNLRWRFLAAVQNLFSRPASQMADTYYHILTATKFQDITGKLININREVMQASNNNKGFFADIKQLLDQGVYPSYVDNKELIDEVWEISSKVTSK